MVILFPCRMGEPEGHQPDVSVVQELYFGEPQRKCGYEAHADVVGAWNVSLAISGLAEAA